MTIQPRDISIKLNKRFGFDGADVKFKNKKWSVADELKLPVEVGFYVKLGELVIADVGLGHPDTGYSTICAPRVNINTSTYLVKGEVNLTLSNNTGRFTAKMGGLQPQFNADVDDRNCEKLAVAICAFVGGMAGPIGAATMAIICGDKIDDAKKDLHTKMADKVDETIKGLKLDTTF